MACKLKIWFMVLCIALMVANLGPLVRAEPQVPCYFVFGDSLFDNGNNNDIEVDAKVNYYPYGMDFSDGPTGRFSNGRNMPDVVAERLGFDIHDIPPFAKTKDRDVLKGVNYASGGAGIRNETGQHQGHSICLSKQLQNHQVTMEKIATSLGSKEKAAQHLMKCMYSVGIGSNDYINNYLLPKFYSTNREYTPEQYATILMKQYDQHLRTLHNYGARKIALFGVALVGCIPQMKALNPNVRTPCVDSINHYVKLFNEGLKSLVDQLNQNLTDAKFIYVNTVGISSIEFPIIGGGE
ncbi:GDSL esterase/lipase At1g29670-like [Cornus florida]|uniref:GDSL esterase/lipase At1g29670-like n=1 Tax=Cornus florida TaxID=4283 RepID=UPI00289B2528|nr:GDSL esterase/lipase At1g29670-like [Cornus florida]